MPLFWLRCTRVVLGWNAEIAEAPAVELRRLMAHNMLQHQPATPRRRWSNRRLDAIVQMIGRDHAAGAGHVLDDACGIAGK